MKGAPRNHPLKFKNFDDFFLITSETSQWHSVCNYYRNLDVREIHKSALFLFHPTFKNFRDISSPPCILLITHHYSLGNFHLASEQDTSLSRECR